MSSEVAPGDTYEYVKIRDDEPNILICYDKRISKHHEVYLGKQILEDGSAKQVAIKLVPVNEHHKREIAIMLSLPAHVNTVGYIRNLERKQPPAWYIVMELCKQNLYQLIQQTELTLETKKTILLHIATGLCHLHQNRILHRDLKPQNLLLSLDGLHIKLCDFGLSKEASEIDISVSKSARHIGTEGWGSPESYTITKKDLVEVLEKMSSKSDVFSAGLMFFFVTSDGKHPCGEDSSNWSVAIKDKTPINISGLTVGNGNTSAEEALIKHLISNMLAKNPAERPKSDEVLSHALFWDISKRIELLVYVYQNITLIDNLAAKVRIGEGWCSKLKNIPDDTDQKQTTSICAKAESIQAEEGGKEPLPSFLELLNYYHKEMNTQSTENRPDCSFKTAEEMWTYFFNRLPEVFVDIFNWYWKELPEILSEEFRERFEKEPPNRKLIPAIDNVRTVFEGRNIHISWGHSSEEPVTYRIRAFCDDVKLDAVTDRREYVLENAKSSSNLQIKIYAENKQGSRSPVCDSKFNTPPSMPENVTATQHNSTIIVDWTAPKDDSVTEFFVRVKQSECPHGNTESTVVKATGRPFKLNLPLPSRIYTFNVFAVSTGELKGPESHSVSVETNPSQLRDTKVKFLELNRSFNITWNKAANESVTYCLQLYCNGEPESKIALTNTEYEFKEAMADNQYEFEVWAQNKFGQKAVGKTIKTKKVSLPPKRIEDARISKSGQSLKIEWKPLEGGIEYRVQVLSDHNVLEDTATNEPCYELAAPTPKMNYQFKVWAKNKHGVDGESVTLGPVTTKSSVVQEMEIEQVADGLHLSWSKLDPQDAKHYRVQTFCRAISNDKEEQEVTAISTDSNTYTLENPTPSMQYMFTVQAMDSWNAYGPTSSSKWVTTAPKKVDELNLKIDIRTKNCLRATWKQIGNHGYRVYVFKNGVRGEANACETGEYEFPVERNCRYFVKVSAINEGDIVGPEKQSNTTMLPPEKVKAIKHIFENNVVRFSWDPSPQATSYTVELRKSPPVEKAKNIIQTDETEFSAPIEPSSHYKCTVIARNQYDVAADGTELEISTPPPELPSLTGKYEDGKITFKWHPVMEAVAYKLELMTETRSRKSNTILDKTTDTVLKYSAGFSEKHTLSVVAEDKNGMNSAPSMHTISTPPSRVAITKTAHKDNKIILTWSTLDDPGLEYFVETFVNGKSQKVESNGDQTTFYLPNPNGTYRFEVWARNCLEVEGERSKSSELKIEPSQPTNADQPERHHSDTDQTVVMDQGNEPKKDTKEQKLITVPQAPKVTADLVDSKIIVKCEAPDDSDLEFCIGVEKKNSSGTIIDQYESKLIGKSYELEPSPSTSYVFKVYGIGESGRGEAAESDTIQIPPSQLKGLNAKYEAESGSFQVTWLQPTEEMTDYLLQVYCNGSVHGDVKQLETCFFQFPAHSHKDKYCFEVWARNGFGLEGPVTRTLELPVPPPRLQNITVSKNESSISLRWDRIDGDVSYCVQVNSKTNKSADTHITTEPHYEFTTSLPAKNYHFKIWARSKYGTDGPSDIRGWSVPSVGGLELTAKSKCLKATWDSIKGHSFGVSVFLDEVLEEEKIVESNTYIMEAQSSKQYHVEVRAINADGDEGESARSKIAMLVPGCVDEINTRVRDDILQISFDQVFGASLYVIKLYEESSTEPVFSSESKETSAWIKVRPSTNYELSVRAKNELGESGDEKKQELDTPPEKVTSLQAEYRNGQMMLRWDEQKNAAYVVKIYDEEDKLITQEETQKPQFIQPLRPSQKIRVTIFTRIRSDQLSEGVEKILCSPPLPVGQTEVSVQNGTVTLKWKKMDEGGITYNIQMFCDNDPQSIEERGSDTTEISITDLQANKKYYFDIWATNRFGKMGEKTRSLEITTPMPPPHIVSGLYGRYVDEEIEYKWDSLERDDLKYQVEVLKYENDEGTVIDKTLTSDALFRHSAEYSQRYRIRVRVQDMSGWMGVPTESSIIPTPPPELRIKKVVNTGGAMEIEWEALSDHGVMYNVQPISDDEDIIIKCDSSTTKYTHTNLLPQKRYFFNVWATNEFSVDGKKTRSRQLVNGIPGPRKVTKLIAEFTNNELVVSWKEVSEAETYIIEVNRDEPFINILTDETNQTQFSTGVSQLHPSTKYLCSVRGKNGEGSEGEEAYCYFCLPSVSYINAQIEGDRICIAWQPVENSKYQVWLHNNSTEKEKTFIASEPHHSFVFDYSQSYIFRVAVHEENTRQPPQYINCTIKTPPRPVKITKTNYRNGVIVLNWRKSGDVSVKYNIQTFINGEPLPIATIDGSANEYQMPNVPASEDQYHFDIWAENKFGIGSEKRRSKLVIPAARTTLASILLGERRDLPGSSSGQGSDSASTATSETGVSAGSERASTSTAERGAVARVFTRVRATITGEQQEERRDRSGSSPEKKAGIAPYPTTPTAANSTNEKRRPASEKKAAIAPYPTTPTAASSTNEKRRPASAPVRMARATAEREAKTKTTSVFEKD